MMGGDGYLFGYFSHNGKYYFPQLGGAVYEAGSNGGYQLREPDGQVSEFTFDGYLSSMLDLDRPERNVYLTYENSGAGKRLSRVFDSAGRFLSFHYNADSYLVRVTKPDGSNVDYVYDGQGNLASVDYGNGEVRRYVYGEVGLAPSGDAGLLTGIISEDGIRYASFGYDIYGRVVSSGLSGQAGLVEKTELSYPSSTRAVVRSMTGEVTSYDFVDVWGRKPVSSQSSYRSTAISYGNYGLPSSYASPGGAYTEYAHDYVGHILKKSVKAGVSVQPSAIELFSWDSSANRLSEKKLLNGANVEVARWGWSYNSRGQLASVSRTDPSASVVVTSTTTYCEDALVCGMVDLPLQIDGPRTDVSDVLAYSYYLIDDPACASSPVTCLYRKGDLRKISNALGHSVETLAYDGAGRAVAVKDANGVMHEYSYGSRGWLVSYRVNGGGGADRVMDFEYWPTGLISGVTMPDGSYTGYVYDAAHRLTDVLDGAGGRIHYTLDGAGKRIKEETFGAGDALKRSLSRVYDVLGRMTTEKGADGHGPTYGYDPNGNMTSAVDARGVSGTATYDALNRLTQSLQDVGGIAAGTQFKYDALGNLIEVTDPKGLKTTYTYDGLGQLKTTSSPDIGTTQRTYDAAGNLKTTTDARGITVSYSYDALNRVTSVDYPGQSEDVTYTYDTPSPGCVADEAFGVGRLSSMLDGSGRTDYCYNRFGDVVRKVQVTIGKTFVVRYTYTAGGNLASVIYPNGAIADYVRDAQGRITEVGVASGINGRQVLLTGAAYLPFGPSTGWVYGNGRALVRSFDLDYRPTAVVDSANQIKIGLGYDSVSNIAALVSNDFTADLDYDALARLTEYRDAVANVAIEKYTYDATGNRLSVANAGDTVPYAYEATSHRLTSIGGSQRTYDALGNTITAVSGVKELVYNQGGRLSQMKLGGAVAQKYAYNARGERVQRGLDATSAVYTAYDEAGHWLGDYDALGNATQQVIWMDDMPVGLLVDGVLHYIEADHLGTPRLVYDPARNLPVWTWSLKGEVFGSDLPDQDPDGDGQAFVFDMRFPGQRYDAVSGLHYNYFRDYEPSSGRYVQSDPIGLEGGISTYGYVGGSPLGAIDPLGLKGKSAPSAHSWRGYQGTKPQPILPPISKTTFRSTRCSAWFQDS